MALAQRVTLPASWWSMKRDLPRDVGIHLYPAQAEGVRRFVGARRNRLVLAYGTGCGKTATALKGIEALMQRRGGPTFGRVLIVCPAMVRRHWCREAARWVGMLAHPVEYGRQRQLSRKEARERDLAYAARWQVVSYDLLGQVDPKPYAVIVFDEIHHLAHWSSRQSTLARALTEVNPEAAMLGLSATLVPTEVKQLWHPLRVMFGPNAWGDIPRVGDVNWDFAREYCHIEETAYGKRVHGAKPKAVKALRQRLLAFAHRVRREDIAADMPALSVKMLDIPGAELSHATRSRGAVVRRALEWHRDLPPDVHRSVILTYHREEARAIVEGLAGHPVEHIDGSMPTAQRAEVIARCEQTKDAVLVATSESVREGIRMMWAQRVLLAQWRQSPVQVIQVLGRFTSVGDTRRPDVEVLTDESLYGAAEVLLERTRAINAVVQAGKVEDMVQEVFAPRELTEDRMAQLTADMLAQHNTGPEREAWAEDNDDEELW